MTEVKNKTKKIFRGVVVSDKADKTIVVSIHNLKTHPKYLKKYRVTKKYQVHDPENKYKIGDTVDFAASRPISKHKNFKVI